MGSYLLPGVRSACDCALSWAWPFGSFCLFFSLPPSFQYSPDRHSQNSLVTVWLLIGFLRSLRLPFVTQLRSYLETSRENGQSYARSNGHGRGCLGQRVVAAVVRCSQIVPGFSWQERDSVSVVGHFREAQALTIPSTLVIKPPTPIETPPPPPPKVSYSLPRRHKSTPDRGSLLSQQDVNAR